MPMPTIREKPRSIQQAQAAKKKKPKKPNNGFGQVPNKLWGEPASPTAKTLYGILLSHCRPEHGRTRCWPSLKTLRNTLGESRRGQIATKTVLRALRDLEAAGLIVIEQHGGGHPRWKLRAAEDLDDLADWPEWKHGEFGPGYDHTEHRNVYRLRLYVRNGRVIDERHEVIDEGMAPKGLEITVA